MAHVALVPLLFLQQLATVACVVCVAITSRGSVLTVYSGMYGSVECSGLHLLRTSSVFVFVSVAVWSAFNKVLGVLPCF
jgi:hypothetical protein